MKQKTNKNEMREVNETMTILEFIKNMNDFNRTNDLVYFDTIDVKEFLTDDEIKEYERLTSCTRGQYLSMWISIEDDEEFDNDEIYGVNVEGGEGAYHTLYDGEYPMRDVLIEMIEEMKDEVAETIDIYKNCGEEYSRIIRDEWYDYCIIQEYGKDYGVEFEISDDGQEMRIIFNED